LFELLLQTLFGLSGLSAEAEESLQQQLEQRIHTAQPLRLIFKDEMKVNSDQ